MNPRALATRLCAAVLLGALLVAGPTQAVDVKRCRLVAEGRAAVIGFEAVTADGRQVSLDGLLTRPDGTAPASAMVMLPGSGGLVTPYCYGSVSERFADWGFATLIVAPTTARDGGGNPLYQYSFADLATYARGAAAALAALPRVDPARIGLWGHSRGGGAVIDAVSGAAGGRSPFRAAVAAAPVCPAKAVPPTIPLLVLVGSEDGDVNVDWCVDYAAQLEDAGGFAFFLISNAGHLYWAPGAPGYDETAARLAALRLKDFLAKHLRAAP